MVLSTGSKMAQGKTADDFSFDTFRAPDVGAQAQASLLLLESLIHSLLDNGALTKAQALEALTAAYDVKAESAATLPEPEDRLQRSLSILTRMRISLSAHSGRYHPPSDPDDEAIGTGRSDA